MDIWQSAENPSEFFGRNKDLLAFNKSKGGTLLVENETALEIISNNVEGIPAPPVLLTNPATKKKKAKKKTKKDEKVINIAAIKNGRGINIQVRQAEGVSPMPMPPVVGNDERELGYGSPSMIRGEDDGKTLDDRMRQCLPAEEREEIDAAEEEGNPAPPVVGK